MLISLFPSANLSATTLYLCLMSICLAIFVHYLSQVDILFFTNHSDGFPPSCVGMWLVGSWAIKQRLRALPNCMWQPSCWFHTLWGQPIRACSLISSWVRGKHSSGHPFWRDCIATVRVASRRLTPLYPAHTIYNLYITIIHCIYFYLFIWLTRISTTCSTTPSMPSPSPALQPRHHVSPTALTNTLVVDSMHALCPLIQVYYHQRN